MTTDRTCPACNATLGPTEPLCAPCWDRLPIALQQKLACDPHHQLAIAQAVEWMRTRAPRAAQLRAAAAARAKARR